MSRENNKKIKVLKEPTFTITPNTENVEEDKEFWDCLIDELNTSELITKKIKVRSVYVHNHYGSDIFFITIHTKKINKKLDAEILRILLKVYNKFLKDVPVEDKKVTPNNTGCTFLDTHDTDGVERKIPTRVISESEVRYPVS